MPSLNVQKVIDISNGCKFYSLNFWFWADEAAELCKSAGVNAIDDLVQAYFEKVHTLSQNSMYLVQTDDESVFEEIAFLYELMRNHDKETGRLQITWGELQYI